MMNFINESMQRVESTFYEMTHVTEVGSYGYNMANFTAFCIWFLIVIGVIFFIYSDGFSNILWDLSERLYKKGISLNKNK